MESEKPFNPPAFPCEAQGNRSVPPEHDHLQTGVYSSKFPGMTLRDYFAGQALVSMGQWMPEHGGSNLTAKRAMDARALWAYEQADAMLAARNA